MESWGEREEQNWEKVFAQFKFVSPICDVNYIILYWAILFDLFVLFIYKYI